MILVERLGRIAAIAAVSLVFLAIVAAPTAATGAVGAVGVAIPVPTPVPRVTAVGAGGDHSCAVTDAGAVKCWGANQFGELGIGTTSGSQLPVDVSGLRIGIRSVVPGTFDTCAVTTAGGAMCWGRLVAINPAAPTSSANLIPLGVVGFTGGGVREIASGRLHRCLLTTQGGVKCWGGNARGQLGIGRRFTTTAFAPLDVAGLASGVTVIAAGDGQTCAVVNSGVKCWGANNFGQVGDGTTVDRYLPVDVVGLTSGVVAITAGGLHTCAMTQNADVQCWGRNIAGELGNGTTTDSAVPVQVTGPTGGVYAITAGVLHTCALTPGGGVKCWGYGGRLGNGSDRQSSVPVDVVGLKSGALDSPRATGTPARWSASA